MVPGLRSRDFRLLWASATVSGFGSQFSLLAFPTIAVLDLHAGPVAVGALEALGFLPVLVLSMVSGVIADRGDRRRIVILCELTGMVATGTVPLLAVLGHLTIAQLFAVALVNGTAGNLGDITFHSMIPVVVERDAFDRANARLEGSHIGTEVTGPGAAGLLIQLIGAARAVTADAVSFALSAVLVAGVRLRGRLPRQAPTTFRTDLVEGARFVFGDRRLRRLAIASAISNLGAGMAFAVVLIYLYRTVHLTPGEVGLITTTTGVVGAVLAFNAPAVSRRFGYARTLAGSGAINGLGWLLLPLAGGAWAVPVVVIAFTCRAIEGGLWNVAMITLRRSFTPDHMFGRMVASTRTVAQGTSPLGAILGGIVGATAGIVPALIIGGALMGLCGFVALDRELLAITAPVAPEDELAASAQVSAPLT